MSSILGSLYGIKRRVQQFSKKINSQIITTVLTAIIVFATVMIPARLEALSNENTQAAENVKLATDSQMVVVVVRNLPKIVPGESTIARDERIAAEAAAQKKQELLKRRDTVSREYRAPSYADPVDFNDIYNRAGEMFGVDPKLIKAIHIAETGASGSTARSNPSGATGPMQFLPSTFRNHAVDGNSDGHADISNVEDAIFTAAKYLKDCGYPDMKKALWGYNPSSRYFNKVVSIMDSL